MFDFVGWMDFENCYFEKFLFVVFIMLDSGGVDGEEV